MDWDWYKEVNNLSLKDQWKKLFERKMKLRGNKGGFWGGGKIKHNAKTISDYLPELFERHNIKSMLDVGCGNFGWMCDVNLSGVKYKGVDIVQDLVDMNKEKYQKDFECFNIVESIPKKYDLVMLRSVFIHLTNRDILKAIDNVKKSGSKYMLASTSPNIKHNKDTECLMLVNRNLEIEPFNLGKPIELINERYEIYMGLWKL